MNLGSVLAPPDCFEVIDTVALAKLSKDVVFLAPSFFGNDRPDRPADHFVSGIAKHSLRSAVPGSDRALQILTHDRVVRRLDDGGEFDSIQEELASGN